MTINKNNLVIVIINQNCDDTEKDIPITKANAYVVNLPSQHSEKVDSLRIGNPIDDSIWPEEPDITISLKDKPPVPRRERRMPL